MLAISFGVFEIVENIYRRGYRRKGNESPNRRDHFCADKDLLCKEQRKENQKVFNVVFDSEQGNVSSDHGVSVSSFLGSSLNALIGLYIDHITIYGLISPYID